MERRPRQSIKIVFADEGPEAYEDTSIGISFNPDEEKSCEHARTELSRMLGRPAPPLCGGGNLRLWRSFWRRLFQKLQFISN